MSRAWPLNRVEDRGRGGAGLLMRLPHRRTMVFFLFALASLAIGLASKFHRANDRDRPRHPASTVAELARVVGSPGIQPVLETPPGELDAMANRLRPNAHTNFSGYVHALHFFGPALKTAEGALPGGPTDVAGLLLDVPTAAELFGGGSILAATRYGLRSPLHVEGRVGTDQSATLSHRGQYLATLGGLGVAANRPIRLADGMSRPVSALRDDLVANFTLEGEIAWDAVALAYYNDTPNWTNKYGKTFSFDDLVGELDAREPGLEACGGTHHLLASTTLVKIDRRKPILSDAARRRTIAGLARRVAQVRASQRDDGSWDLDWPNGGAETTDRHPPSFGDSLIVTGHLLEWLILLPEELRPDAEVYRKGARWVASALPTVGDDPAEIDRLYCPLIHATRSLRLLSRAVEPTAGP